MTTTSARTGTALSVVAVAAGALTTAMSVAPAQAAEAQRVRFMTVNVDFAATAAEVKADFGKYAPCADVVMFQEARDVNLHNLIDTDTWIVRQDTSSESTRGSALAIRRSAVRAADPVMNFRLVKGTVGGSCPDGGIQTRWIAVADVHFRNGATVVAAALHMPPERAQPAPAACMP